MAMNFFEDPLLMAIVMTFIGVSVSIYLSNKTYGGSDANREKFEKMRIAAHKKTNNNKEVIKLTEVEDYFAEYCAYMYLKEGKFIEVSDKVSKRMLELINNKLSSFKLLDYGRRFNFLGHRPMYNFKMVPYIKEGTKTQPQSPHNLFKDASQVSETVIVQRLPGDDFIPLEDMIESQRKAQLWAKGCPEEGFDA